MSEKSPQSDIISRYSLKFDRNFACVSNAVINSARIFNKGGIATMHYVLQSPVAHAYVGCEGVGLNTGVTAAKVTPYTPDYPLSFIQQYGEDMTKAWLARTLDAFSGQKDVIQTRRHLESVFSGQQLINVVNLLQQVYQNLS